MTNQCDLKYGMYVLCYLTIKHFPFAGNTSNRVLDFWLHYCCYHGGKS